jgi:nitrogenase molybdenum-iron protein alpha/beta subunit
MKGLWKYISPFAPDQSGACSVLYDLGGIIVICDAGGCAGNVCGFDEPRWFGKKSAIFSAGLRDMDAILGRDDKLIEKLCLAAKEIDATFAAIVGTPVPSVIGTDYRALRRMAEKRLDMPIMAVDTTGMNHYDSGAEKAYVELFHTFAQDAGPIDKDTIGVIGATPLDMTCIDGNKRLQQALSAKYKQVLVYGIGGIDVVRQAGRAAGNLVISPAGLKGAQYLQKKFGTPYELGYPLLNQVWQADMSQFSGKRVLIVHQQVLANSLRQEICSHSDAAVTVASWFMLKDELKQDGDVPLYEEDQFIELADNDAYDIVIGDPLFRKALKHFTGTYIDLPHFAVSGRM